MIGERALDERRVVAGRLALGAVGDPGAAIDGDHRSSRSDPKDTGTTNPGTGLEVDVFPGDEYVTNLVFDPAAITVIAARQMPPIPEPGTALLLGLGLAGLGARRRR